MKKLSLGLVAAMAFLPMFANAQFQNIEDMVRSIGELVRLATPILIGLALLAFFWGLIKYIFSQGDDGKKDGKGLMIGGIIAIFVMVSIVGIVAFIGRAFGIGQGEILPVPVVERP